MKNASVTITYDDAKITALKRYLIHKDMTLEEELRKTVEKLYHRHVPSAVQDYIEECQDTVAPPRRSKAVDQGNVGEVENG